MNGEEEVVSFYREGLMGFDDEVIVAAGWGGDFTDLVTTKGRIDGGGDIVDGEFTGAVGLMGRVCQITGLIASRFRSL